MAEGFKKKGSELVKWQGIFLSKLALGLYPDLKQRILKDGVEKISDADDGEKRRLSATRLFRAAGSTNPSYTEWRPTKEGFGLTPDKLSANKPEPLRVDAFFTKEFLEDYEEEILQKTGLEILPRNRLDLLKKHPCVADLLEDAIRSRTEDIARFVKGRVCDTPGAQRHIGLPLESGDQICDTDKPGIWTIKKRDKETKQIVSDYEYSLFIDDKDYKDKDNSVKWTKSGKAKFLAKKLSINSSDLSLDALAYAIAEAFVEMVIDVTIEPTRQSDPVFYWKNTDKGKHWGIDKKYEMRKEIVVDLTPEYDPDAELGLTRKDSADKGLIVGVEGDLLPVPGCGGPSSPAEQVGKDAEDELLAAQSDFLHRFVNLYLSLEGKMEGVTEQGAAVVLYGFLKRLDLDSRIDGGVPEWEDILDSIPNNEWIDAYNGDAWFPRGISRGTSLELWELQPEIQKVLDSDFAKSEKGDTELRGFFGCSPDVEGSLLAEGISWVFSKIIAQLPFYRERRRVGNINLDVAAECEDWLDLDETLYELNKEKRTKYEEMLSISEPVEREVVEMGRWHDEPIRWFVVEEDHEKMLLVSEKVLDIVPYDSRSFDYVRIGWKDCGLRIWLNGAFLDEAFNETERARIMHARIKNSARGPAGTVECDYTDDSLFCLSYVELGRIFGHDFLGRLARPTSYVEGKEAFDNHPYAGVAWWLRDPDGSTPSVADCVGPDGSLSGRLFYDDDVGVRPAMYIKKQTGKRCRFGALQVGNYCTFGEWGEQLGWLVLDIRLHKMLLVAERAIDCLPYDRSSNTTWADSSIREWLNGAFLQGAFNDEDRSMIADTTVVGESEPDTSDKVFLLSEAEALRYFVNDEDRSCWATLLAASHGTKPENSRLCYWWLRASYKQDRYQESASVACVDLDGSIYHSVEKSCDFIGVRPAIWVNLD